MSFPPECSLYWIHVAKSTVGFLSCMVFYTRSKTKMVQVLGDMLCLLMAISASFTNNLTIGLLLWTKQKRRTGLFTLSSNCSLANVNMLTLKLKQWQVMLFTSQNITVTRDLPVWGDLWQIFFPLGKDFSQNGTVGKLCVQ